MEAKLIYKTESCKAEFDIANLVARAYIDGSGNCVADVIYTFNNERVVKSFRGKSPKWLALDAADFINENMLDSDIILCLNELPAQTRNFAECAETFKNAFVAEVDAITDAARSIRDEKLRQKQRHDRIFSPYAKARVENQKKLIFGESNE